MKKILTILLTVLTIFTFVACTESKTQTKFEQFESMLDENNIKYEKTTKAAAIVGAKEGYGYKISDNEKFELYLFDKNTDAYKKAVKDNKLIIEGFNMTLDVVFADDLCIYYTGNDDKILDILAKIK